MNPNMYLDGYDNFYAVMEQTTPDNAKIDILEDGTSKGLHFLRFSTCLQDFYGYNRNRRLWKSEHVRQMINDAPVQELLAKGSLVGEAGHPVPDSGKVTLERILTIDPLRCSHRILEFSWPNDKELHATVETLDEGVGSPGYRMMMNILQGIKVAFSLRSVVPQRKNADGSIDVIGGGGRLITYDRVYLPSHTNAYQDESIPVKSIISKPKFETVMESYAGYVTSHSDKVRRIVDDMSPAMESATIDPKTSMVSVPVEGGKVFIAPEVKYRNEIKSFFGK